MSQILSNLKMIFDGKLPEFRRFTKGNYLHPLSSVLIPSICAIFCQCHSYREMRGYAIDNFDYFKSFLDFSHGVPSSDTIRRVFCGINYEQFGWCLREWAGVNNIPCTFLAIDGKRCRGSAHGEDSGVHIVNFFNTTERVTVFEVATDKKDNEITVVKSTLATKQINLHGVTVTADAMLNQKEICGYIIDQEGNYLFSLKNNHPTLFADVEKYMENVQGLETKTTINGDHGRIETRVYSLETNIDWLAQKDEWTGLKGIGRIVRTVEEKGNMSVNTSYFLTSIDNLKGFVEAREQHWKVENNLHWQLDTSFREDAQRHRCGDSPSVLNIIRKTALYFLEKVKSISQRRTTVPELMGRCHTSIRNLEKVLTMQALQM